MDKYKHGVTFRLEKRKDKDGNFPKEMPIMADITFGSKRVWYNVGYRIAPAKWDTATQRVKRNSTNDDGASATDINQRIIKVEHAIEEAFNQLELKNSDLTPAIFRAELKVVLNEEVSTRRTVHEVYQILIDEREKELNETTELATWSKGTLTKHKTMLNHLKDFRKTLYFEDINHDLLYKFEAHLIGKKLSNNYTHKSMKDIKTFLNWATKNGYNKTIHYQTFSPKFSDETKSDDSVNLFALSEEELAAVMSFPTHRAAIDRTRHAFVFACFTSLRFSDVIDLRWSNIDGDMIDCVADKTNKRHRIPLSVEAKRILELYPRDPSEKDPRVFSKISNQQFNKHLKEVGRLAGLTDNWTIVRQCGREKVTETRPKYELLSSHVARRTFITMCLRKGMQAEDIRAITGHTTSDMMMTYVKFNDDSKREKMNILNSADAVRAETVFDYDITDEERQKLGLPTRDAYLEMFEGDTDSAIQHLAVLFHLRNDQVKRTEYMKRLPVEKFNEVMDIIFSINT